MIPLCVLVFITLYAFGLLRQSITYPYEDWHWILVRNIFLQPYFMLYGEVYAAEIDTCGDEIWQTHEDENIPISMLNVTRKFSNISRNTSQLFIFQMRHVFPVTGLLQLV